MAIDSTSPRTRRALLGTGLGALAATAASAVKVPSLFARYHTDVRYQLTAIGELAAVYVVHELDAKGRFVIGSDRPDRRVSWQLTGVRSDPAALRRPFRADVAKPARYRGRYVQPALYGQASSQSLVARGRAPEASKAGR